MAMNEHDSKHSTALTDEERALCEAMGISEQDFIETRAASNRDQLKGQSEIDEKIRRTLDRSNSVGDSK